MIWKILLVISLGEFVLSEKGAISEQRVVIHHLKAEQKNSPSHKEENNAEYREEYAWSYPSYEFSYKVKDPETHDEKGQHEKREGDEVKGLYWLIEPNGHKRTVNYEANDNNGFNAQVEYSPKEKTFEHGNKYVGHTYEVVEVINEDNESNVKQTDANNNNNKEQEEIPNKQEYNTETSLSENAKENNEEKENLENNDNNQEDISNQNENNEESQNNENENTKNENINNENINNENTNNENANNDSDENKNELSDNSDSETQSEGKEKSRRDNNGYHAATINQYIKNRDHDRVKNSIKLNSSRVKNEAHNINRINQSNNKKRHQNNIRENRNIGNKSNKAHNKTNQKQASRISREGRHKEDNSNSNLKISKKERNEVKNNNEQENAASVNIDNKDLNNDDVKYEHRIRIYHPKYVIKKSDDAAKKH